MYSRMYSLRGQKEAVNTLLEFVASKHFIDVIFSFLPVVIIAFDVTDIASLDHVR